MALTFVNYRGEVISDSRMEEMKSRGLDLERQRRAAAKSDSTPMHKGWRVTGVAPESLQKAKADHERLREMAVKAGGAPVEPFDEGAWIRNAKRTPVRSKPYSLPDAAQQCRVLAMKAGWLDVQIQEIKKVSP